jgi:hypothetical protein
MRLLLSYRRADSAGIAGRIFDRLAARYGRQSVFMDVDNIPLGRDFRAHIRAFIETCDAVVIVIGPRWHGPRDAAPSRVHDGDDPVRIEAELALARGVPVIPLLVEGAPMPAAADLPESLASLAYLNAARVDSGADFHHHVSRLLARIDELTGEQPERARIVPRQNTLMPRVVLAAAGAMPLALALARVSPPWPPGLVIISTIVVGGSPCSCRSSRTRRRARCGGRSPRRPRCCSWWRVRIPWRPRSSRTRRRRRASDGSKDSRAAPTRRRSIRTNVRSSAPTSSSQRSTRPSACGPAGPLRR